MNYRPEYDFRLTLPYGEDAERYVADTLGLVGEEFEIKHQTGLRGSSYLEFEQNPRRRGSWVPSGIQTTTARFWAWVIGDSGCFVVFPTIVLQEIFNRRRRGGARYREIGGDNPTRGFVFQHVEAYALAAEMRAGVPDAYTAVTT